ncbi:MAG: ferritin-like domain-containing protein [Solirubrobacteraceae bacterium]
MSNPPDPRAIDRVDPDGVLREGAEALQSARVGQTRSQLFRRGGVLAGAGLAAGAIPIGFAIGQGGLPGGDIKILNYALTLEYLEAAFYAEAIKKGELKGEEAKFAEVVGAHETTHVEALKKVLGGKAVKAPKVDFKDATGAEKFLATSIVLEDTGVSAYQGQAPLIETTEVLATAGAILAVEARHAAWARDIAGDNPAPDAFEMPMDMQAVLDAVEATGFLKG